MLSLEPASLITSAIIPAILSIVLFILLINFTILLINLCTFTRLRATQEGATETVEPLVSVLIPARNEAANIEACVRSLLAQQYSQIEIIVLNDQSSDQTATIVGRLITELPAQPTTSLRLIEGKPLPPGWIGKKLCLLSTGPTGKGSIHPLY
ncbi:glycosyltransferase [Dictyobacter kobayashii]|uniref:Glycosyltransferase 2-like domain-containing protein n=1 Tax=Dictyobacter kobayashii TaxID=2014872 RepID=A0A402AKE2_9CHLR|nr:glycosyltransferase family 2 protein [Dictyobacter kobayashii]GCE19582.1 hypothetical protein KDK_33820 [Dictyobacter kobayashii]